MKIVYLDQSFLSDVWSATQDQSVYGSDQVELHILTRLMALKRLRRVFIVVSDVHVTETAGIPDEYAHKRRGIWELANQIANGMIADGPLDVYVKQQRRAIQRTNIGHVLPLDDIGLGRLYDGDVPKQAFSANQWRLTLFKETTPSRQDVYQGLINILARQAEDSQSLGNSTECHKRVLQLWRADLLDGIDGMRKRRKLFAACERYNEDPTCPMPAFDLASDPPFTSIVSHIIEDLSANALDQFESLLMEDPTGGCCIVRLRTSLEAEVLWSYSMSTRSGLKPKDTKYGVSRMNDISHVSTYLPYVDALTTDNEMAKLCRRGVAGREFGAMANKIYSKETYPAFLRWLDGLIGADPVCVDER